MAHRNGIAPRPVTAWQATPMKRILGALALLTASAALGADFSASDVPGIGIKRPGRIVIRNHGNTITAYRFFGDIRQALLTLHSTRALHTNAYGAVLFDGSARVSTPMPAQLSSVIEDAARTHGVD